MKIYISRSALLITLLLLLVGCYESEVPMAQSGQTKINQQMLGDWQFTGGTGHNGQEIKGLDLLIKIRKFNDHDYFVEWYEEESGPGSKRSHTYWFRAYAVLVDGISFMNGQFIKQMEKADRRFTYCRYSLSEAGILTLHTLNHDMLSDQKLDTSKALYAFIRKNVNDDKLYTATIHLKRVKAPIS